MWEGSVRSGKTYVSVLAFLLAIATSPRDGVILITGRSMGSIYRNFFQTIENSPGLRVFKSQVHYRENNTSAIILGRECQVIGLNNRVSEEKIRGMTIQLVYVDELTTILEATFKQILNRMSLETSRLFATTNPDSPSHWFKLEYLDRLRTLPDWRRYHFLMDDNPSLSWNVKRRLSSQYRGLWYKRFILGEWVSAEGAIYDMWDSDSHVIPFDQLPPMVRLFGAGVDYGTTNATTALTLGLGEDGKLYLTDEWRIDSTNRQQTWTDAQLSAGLIEWMAKPHTAHKEHLRPQFLVIDPAAASFKTQLHFDGVRNIQNADNDVLYGIRTMASLLGEENLYVSDRCTGFISEVTGYSWDAKATAEGIDKPVKLADHSLDGARYVVATTEALWRPYMLTA